MDLSTYTDEQKAVIQHPLGHAKVSAGPGSGKTHTMVGRIQFLLEQGIDSRRLLILMFNKNAQEAFHSKLEKACGAQTIPQVRTFHSFGLTLCQKLTSAGKLRSAKLLTDDYEIQRMLRESMVKGAGACPIQPPNQVLYDPDTFESFLTFVEACKACLDSFQDTFTNQRLPEDYRFFIYALNHFEDLRYQNRFRTFNDLLYDPAIAMLNDESAVRVVTDKFDGVIVDEYQDVNAVQQALLVWTAGKRAEVMVVGDVDQCIYEWRSARPEFLLSGFDRDFQAAKHYSLTRTFRFGHRLSLAANQLITTNRTRDDRICISDKSTPDTSVELVPDTTSVADIAMRWQQQGRALREIAILPRIFALAAPIEIDLLEHQIPYQLVGAESVLHSTITQAFVGWAQASIDGLTRLPKAALRITLKAILSVPPTGLKKTQVEVLLSEMLARPQMIPDILRQAATGAAPTPALQCRKRASLWARFAGRRHGNELAAPFLETILTDSGAEEFFKKAATTDAAADKLALANGLIGFCRNKGLTLQGFIDLISDLRDRSSVPGDDAILITSIHRSKGLEYPLVIVPGLADGSFPPIVPGRSSGGAKFEDERRLFFVAMTRAIERCLLIYPAADEALLQSGERGATIPPPRCMASRFLYESCVPLANKVIDAHGSAGDALVAESPKVANRYLEAIGSPIRVVASAPAAASGSPLDSRQSPFTANLTGNEPTAIYYGLTFSEGQLVEHPAFGRGKIVEFLQDGEMMVVGFGPNFDRERWLKGETAVQAGLRAA